MPFDFGEDEINAMDMVSASCTVNKGDLPIKITWKRNGRQLFSNDGISIIRSNQRISILSIESVRDRHSGNYSCVADNAAGSVNYTTTLWVNGTDTDSKLVPFFIFDRIDFSSASIHYFHFPFIWFKICFFLYSFGLCGNLLCYTYIDM